MRWYAVGLAGVVAIGIAVAAVFGLGALWVYGFFALIAAGTALAAGIGGDLVRGWSSRRFDDRRFDR
jgi:hypothetical protein